MNAQIIDTDGKVLPNATVIAKYFRQSHETTRDFFEQLRKLTDEDKMELALGAAKELGLTVKTS